MLKRLFLDDRLLLWPIAINAVVLFALGFPQLPADAVRWLNLVDDAITIVFAIEAAVKLREWGVSRYFASNWNRFDFALIVLSTPTLLDHLVDIGDADVGFLLVLRVCRVFKFFRFLRFVPGIEQMIQGVQRALRASLMMVMAFFIALFMTALLSAKVFGEISPEHYGDPLRALYSTFKIFTVEGWYEIPDDVVGQLSGVPAFFARLYFAGLLLGAGVLGLSLVNSVFVDAMVSDNNADLEAKVDALRADIAALRRDLTARGRGEERDPPPPRGR